MKKVIAISGTHGAGKSFQAYNLCTHLRKQGKDAVVLDELARKSPFEINQGANDETQIWLGCIQVAKELEGIQRYQDYLIADRSVLDSFCYGLALQKNGWIFKNLKDYLVAHINKYYYKLYLLDPEFFQYNVEDGVRDTDPVFREKIHQQILTLYNETGVSYTLVQNELTILNDFA